MDPNPIRPMRGRSRGRPQLPNMAANQTGNPIPPRPQFTPQPRPIQITAQPIQQVIQPGMNRPPRPMPPRPSNMPIQRAPRPPLGPRPPSGGHVVSAPKIDTPVRNHK